MSHTILGVPPAVPPHSKPFMQRLLDGIERVGNKVPHPAVIFIALIVLVILLSHVFYMTGASVTYESINPETHALEETTTAVQSLLTAAGIRFMYADMVRNFMNFTAVGVIIVAMLGVGVAEAAGLVKALIRKLVLIASPEGADVHPGVRRDPVEHRRGRRIPGPDSARGGGVRQRGPAIRWPGWPPPSPASPRSSASTSSSSRWTASSSGSRTTPIHLVEPQPLDLPDVEPLVLDRVGRAADGRRVADHRQVDRAPAGPVHARRRRRRGRRGLSAEESRGLKYALWALIGDPGRLRRC